MWYVPWDPSVPHGTYGMAGSRVYCVVHHMGSQCTTWYRQAQGSTVWYAPWDLSIPCGTDGMGWTCGTAWLKGVLRGTSQSALHGTDGMDGMGYWDCLAQGCTAWYVPGDPSVPHGTNGMGHTTWLKGVLCGTSYGIPVYQMVQSVTAWLKGVLCGTSHGIPAYPVVQMGWDGHVGLPGSRVYCVVRPKGSQCTTWYRRDG